jgi:hypothetical protein
MPRRALLALSMFLPACVVARTEINDPIDATVVATLKPGKTTAREVVEKLGAPTDVVQLGKRTAYRYDASCAKTAALILLLFNMYGQDARSDRVWVFFDANDVLTHVGSSYATHRTQYALPWENVHEESDNAARDAYRPGLNAK